MNYFLFVVCLLFSNILIAENNEPGYVEINTPDEIKIECKKEGKNTEEGYDLYSLLITFEQNNQKYEFYSRRAWAKDWCLPAKKIINNITDSGSYKIEGVYDFLEKDVSYGTLIAVVSNSAKWSYFTK